MDEISINAYLPLCEQYHSLAQSFYQQYLTLRKEVTCAGEPFDFFETPENVVLQYNRNIGILQTAICAIVFECFAIESYVNFWGAYRLGDDVYYKKYETGTRYSTTKKIELLCKNEFHSSYPMDGTHFLILQQLFSKRNRLAHNKPKEHTIGNNNGYNFDDYNEAISEISFITSGIDSEMQLYEAVKYNFSIASNLPNPIIELEKKFSKAIMNSAEQITTLFPKNDNI